MTQTPYELGAEILAAAQQLDPQARWSSDEGFEYDGCLLVAHSAVDALIALYPDAWEDPNEPVLPSHTRVVFPATMIVGTET